MRHHYSIVCCLCAPVMAQVVLTEDGSAAKAVAKYRPPCPVVVACPSERVLRQLGVVFGVYPCKVRQQQMEGLQGQAAAARLKRVLAMAGRNQQLCQLSRPSRRSRLGVILLNCRMKA
jgi:pyruvate kinase